MLRLQEKKDMIFAAALTVQRIYRGHLGRASYRTAASQALTECHVAGSLHALNEKVK